MVQNRVGEKKMYISCIGTLLWANRNLPGNGSKPRPLSSCKQSQKIDCFIIILNPWSLLQTQVLKSDL